MKDHFNIWFRSGAVAALLALTHCGDSSVTEVGGTADGVTEAGVTETGGTEAGNPPKTRLIRGRVPRNAGTGQCVATQVVFTDSKDQLSSGPIDSDCTFSMSVNKGDAQTVTLFDEEVFVAIIEFNHSDSLFKSNVLTVGGGSGAIDFGQIQLVGVSGIPAEEPASQNDQDDDGTVDFADEDDDNNGTPDIEERDCDFDGFFDIYDSDNSDCEGVGDVGEVPLQPGEDRILEALPRNKAKYVSVDQPIKVRANCTVDETSVSSATFNVGDATGGHVACNVSFASSKKVVVCDHGGFLSNMGYTVTVEGLRCADHGDTVRTVTWHFTTAVPGD